VGRSLLILAVLKPIPLAQDASGSKISCRHQRILPDLTYRIEISLVSAMVAPQANIGDMPSARDHARFAAFSLLKGVSWRSQQ
jgi:hypothetical protein